MNYIDIAVLVILLFALFNGWRRGFIIQLCSLLGLMAGVWLGTHYGKEVGELLHFSTKYTAIGGFATVFIAVLIIVAILSRLARGVFKFAGLGILDVTLGAAFSALKSALILSICFSTFSKLNKDLKIVDAQSLESSITYKPLVDLSSKVIPSLQWAQGVVEDGIKEL